MDMIDTLVSEKMCPTIEFEKVKDGMAQKL
jgi:hypothetical protein